MLLTDAAASLVEGPGFNIFGLSHGVLVTPKDGVPEGVSHRTVIEIARSIGLKVELRALPADELRRAEKTVRSGSGGGVLPVTWGDNQVLANGASRPITRQLLQIYWDWHSEPAYRRPVEYSA